VGLRGIVNTGSYGYELDDSQPAKSAIETFAKHAREFLSWFDVDKFFEEFKELEIDDVLWRAVVEEIQKKLGLLWLIN